MECTFHNPYVILWLLCLVQWISRQSSSTYTKATQTRLHCSWVEVYMAVNMNWLTVTKYQFLKRQWIFFFLLNTLFFPLSSTRVDRTWLWITWQVSYKKARTVYHVYSSSPILCGVRVAQLFSFLCVFFLRAVSCGQMLHLSLDFSIMIMSVVSTNV
jgi:hypothetical protein